MSDVTATPGPPPTGGGAIGAAPPPPSARERWHSLPAWARRLLAAAAVVLGLNAGLAGLESVTGGAGPEGPVSSSYATAPRGLAALAELLRDQGHPVRRLRAGLDDVALDPAATLVVADAPDLTEAEVDAVARFVDAGGRLVVAGRPPGALRPVLAGSATPTRLSHQDPSLGGRFLVQEPTPSRLSHQDPAPGGRFLVQEPTGRSGLAGQMEWSPVGATPARPVAPVPEVRGVTTVVAAGTGSWSDAGASLPILAGEDEILATASTRGRGRVVAVADASVWQNRLLAEADNAAFAVAAVGERGRPVDFAEYHHGYGRARGLAAVPARWKWALAGALAAVVVAMWSRARRLGPPEDAERDLPPPRRAYVDAMAATLVRTGRPAESLAPLQDAARRRLADRTGLAPGAPADDARRAAAGLGLVPEEVDALLGPVATDDEMLAAGRALARLEGGPR